jgi:hypothetical protein
VAASRAFIERVKKCSDTSGSTTVTTAVKDAENATRALGAASTAPPPTETWRQAVARLLFADCAYCAHAYRRSGPSPPLAEDAPPEALLQAACARSLAMFLKSFAHLQEERLQRQVLAIAAVSVLPSHLRSHAS